MMEVEIIEILNDNNELLVDCINHWGKDMQLNIVIEEMAELTKEICKHKRGGCDLFYVMEEAVDVLIMINQLYIIADFYPTVFKDLLVTKLDRISNRLLLAKQESE